MSRYPLFTLFAGLLVAAACSGEAPAPAADPASLRQPPAGDILGVVSDYGSHVWRGIPYAEPPVGALRWRAPRPASRWSGTREVLVPGAICPQLASPMAGDTTVRAGTPVGSEDCLVLDVWAPRMAPDAVPSEGERLPVMVWIHGGGNVVGASRFYDGGKLAANEQVVVVGVNYRLGPLGWFSHPALRGQGTTPLDRSGNYGTLDLVQALEWVSANIAAFGGDPGNVTIFGESAGARNVLSLLVAPQAAGLFHRAISQSGGTETASRSEAEHLVDAPEPGDRNSSGEVLLRLFVARGRAASRDAAVALVASMSDVEIEAALRDASPAELMAAYGKGQNEGLIDVPQLFRDGAVLPQASIAELFASGERHPVPVMLGTNLDEYKVFLIFDRELATWWFGRLPRLKDPERYQAIAESMSGWWKATAADGLATGMVAAGASDVFVYRFDWDEEPSLFGLADLATLIGASHAFEIPFVFGHWDLGPMSKRLFTAENLAGREILSAQMMSYWAQFAQAGAPGRGRRGELPEWKPWSDAAIDSPRYVVLDTPAGGGVRMETDPVTPAEIIAAIDADPRFATQRDRCAMYRRLALWGRAFDEERYESAGMEGCAEFPIAAYPWNDVTDVAAGG